MGVHEKTNIQGGIALKRGLRQFADLRGDLVKNSGGEGVFDRREVDTPMHTMKLAITLTAILMYWCQCPRC